MYQLGTPAQDYKILSAHSIMELETIIVAHLAEDWRLHGTMQIEQNINGSIHPGGQQSYQGMHGQSSVSYTLPTAAGGFINTMFRYIQVMVK